VSAGGPGDSARPVPGAARPGAGQTTVLTVLSPAGEEGVVLLQPDARAHITAVASLPSTRGRADAGPCWAPPDRPRPLARFVGSVSAGHAEALVRRRCAGPAAEADLTQRGSRA